MSAAREEREADSRQASRRERYLRAAELLRKWAAEGDDEDVDAELYDRELADTALSLPAVKLAR